MSGGVKSLTGVCPIDADVTAIMAQAREEPEDLTLDDEVDVHEDDPYKRWLRDYEAFDNKRVANTALPAPHSLVDLSKLQRAYNPIDPFQDLLFSSPRYVGLGFDTKYTDGALSHHLYDKAVESKEAKRDREKKKKTTTFFEDDEWAYWLAHTLVKPQANFLCHTADFVHHGIATPFFLIQWRLHRNFRPSATEAAKITQWRRTDADIIRRMPAKSPYAVYLEEWDKKFPSANKVPAWFDRTGRASLFKQYVVAIKDWAEKYHKVPPPVGQPNEVPHEPRVKALVLRDDVQETITPTIERVRPILDTYIRDVIWGRRKWNESNLLWTKEQLRRATPSQTGDKIRYPEHKRVEWTLSVFTHLIAYTFIAVDGKRYGRAPEAAEHRYQQLTTIVQQQLEGNRKYDSNELIAVESALRFYRVWRHTLRVWMMCVQEVLFTLAKDRDDTRKWYELLDDLHTIAQDQQFVRFLRYEVDISKADLDSDQLIERMLYRASPWAGGTLPMWLHVVNFHFDPLMTATPKTSLRQMWEDGNVMLNATKLREERTPEDTTGDVFVGLPLLDEEGRATILQQQTTAEKVARWFLFMPESNNKIFDEELNLPVYFEEFKQYALDEGSAYKKEYKRKSDELKAKFLNDPRRIDEALKKWGEENRGKIRARATEELRDKTQEWYHRLIRNRTVDLPSVRKKDGTFADRGYVRDGINDLVWCSERDLKPLMEQSPLANTFEQVMHFRSRDVVPAADGWKYTEEQVTFEESVKTRDGIWVRQLRRVRTPARIQRLFDLTTVRNWQLNHYLDSARRKTKAKEEAKEGDTKQGSSDPHTIYRWLTASRWNPDWMKLPAHTTDSDYAILHELYALVWQCRGCALAEYVVQSYKWLTKRMEHLEPPFTQRTVLWEQIGILSYLREVKRTLLNLLTWKAGGVFLPLVMDLEVYHKHTLQAEADELVRKEVDEEAALPTSMDREALTVWWIIDEVEIKHVRILRKWKSDQQGWLAQLGRLGAVARVPPAYLERLAQYHQSFTIVLDWMDEYVVSPLKVLLHRATPEDAIPYLRRLTCSLYVLSGLHRAMQVVSLMRVLSTTHMKKLHTALTEWEKERGEDANDLKYFHSNQWQAENVRQGLSLATRVCQKPSVYTKEVQPQSVAWAFLYRVNVTFAWEKPPKVAIKQKTGPEPLEDDPTLHAAIEEKEMLNPETVVSEGWTGVPDESVQDVRVPYFYWGVLKRGDYDPATQRDKGQLIDVCDGAREGDKLDRWWRWSEEAEDRGEYSDWYETPPTEFFALPFAESKSAAVTLTSYDTIKEYFNQLSKRFQEGSRGVLQDNSALQRWEDAIVDLRAVIHTLEDWISPEEDESAPLEGSKVVLDITLCLYWPEVKAGIEATMSLLKDSKPKKPSKKKSQAERYRDPEARERDEDELQEALSGRLAKAKGAWDKAVDDFKDYHDARKAALAKDKTLLPGYGQDIPRVRHMTELYDQFAKWILADEAVAKTKMAKALKAHMDDRDEKREEYQRLKKEEEDAKHIGSKQDTGPAQFRTAGLVEEVLVSDKIERGIPTAAKEEYEELLGDILRVYFIITARASNILVDLKAIAVQAASAASRAVNPKDFVEVDDKEEEALAEKLEKRRGVATERRELEKGLLARHEQVVKKEKKEEEKKDEPEEVIEDVEYRYDEPEAESVPEEPEPEPEPEAEAEPEHPQEEVFLTDPDDSDFEDEGSSSDDDDEEVPRSRKRAASQELIAPMKEARMEEIKREIVDLVSDSSMEESDSSTGAEALNISTPQHLTWCPDLYVAVGRFRESLTTRTVAKMAGIYSRLLRAPQLYKFDSALLTKAVDSCRGLATALRHLEESLFDLVLLMSEESSTSLEDSARGFAIAFHEYRGLVKLIYTHQAKRVVHAVKAHNRPQLQECLLVPWRTEWQIPTESMLSLHTELSSLSPREQRRFAVGKRKFARVSVKDVLLLLRQLATLGVHNDHLMKVVTSQQQQEYVHGAFYRMALSLGLAYLRERRVRLPPSKD